MNFDFDVIINVSAKCGYLDIIEYLNNKNKINLFDLKDLICSVNNMSNLDYLPESIISLTICDDDSDNEIFSLNLENLPKSINHVIYSKNLLPNLYVNKNVWNSIRDDSHIDILNVYKLEKKNKIQPKPNIFCPNPSNFVGSEICDECRNMNMNCVCEYLLNYKNYDSDF